MPTTAQPPMSPLVSPPALAPYSVAEVATPFKEAARMRAALPTTPRVPPEVRLIVPVEPAGRDKEASESSAELMPVPPAVTVSTFQPWATDKAPRDSVEAIAARPRKLRAPPRRVTPAESARRSPRPQVWVLSRVSVA